MDDLYHLFSLFGQVHRMSAIFKSGKNMVLVQFAAPEFADRALRELNGQTIQGLCTLEIQPSQLDALSFAKCDDKNHDYSSAFVPRPQAPGGPLAQLLYGGLLVPQAGPAHGMVAGVGTNAPQGPVLFVAGLDPEHPNSAKEIFLLFSLYGTVLSVKVLAKKRDSALVQMASPAEAQTTKFYLHSCPYRNSFLKVSPSKFESVTLGVPRGEEPQDASLTASQQNMPKLTYKHINPCSPSRGLHISGLPEGTTEQEVIALFSSCGNVECFEFFSTTRAKGTIVFDSVASAINGIVTISAQPRQLQSGKTVTLHIGFAKKLPKAAPAST